MVIWFKGLAGSVFLCQSQTTIKQGPKINHVFMTSSLTSFTDDLDTKERSNLCEEQCFLTTTDYVFISIICMMRIVGLTPTMHR